MEKPRLLQGFRDSLPSTMRLRESIISRVKHVYELYGFLPLDTPTLEYADLLMGKYGQDEKLIYHFKDHGDRHVAMRYDLTVPLARVATSYVDLPKPFKRYQIGPVWRADSPQAGRYREFLQCDVDTVGSSSYLADAEIIMTMADMMKALELDNQFVIRLSHRGVFNAILRSAGITQTAAGHVMRTIDKLDKIGEKAVRLELVKVVDESAIKTLFSILAIKNADALLEKLSTTLAHDEPGMLALANLSDIYTLVSHLGEALLIDLSIVRGLEYYTGAIFETNLKNRPEIGSICSGGRYDKLMHDLAGVEMPAVGTSLGLDRLMATLEHTSLPESNQVVMAVFPGYEQQSFQLADQLRQHDIPVALALGHPKLGKQFQYADSIGARAVILYGEAEEQNKQVVVRNMQSGEQTAYALDSVEDVVKALRQNLHDDQK